MSDEKHKVSEALMEHYRLTWEMLEDAIDAIPDDHWRTGVINYLIPSRQVAHILETVDYYASEDSESYRWGHRFKVPLWEAAPNQYPSKQEAATLQLEKRRKVSEWLSGLTDEELLAPQTDYKWTGGTQLSRALYLLVHYRQHMGEINAELRHRGLPRIKWRTLS